MARMPDAEIVGERVTRSHRALSGYESITAADAVAGGLSSWIADQGGNSAPKTGIQRASSSKSNMATGCRGGVCG